MHTEGDLEDIFSLGQRALAIEWRRRKKGADVRRTIEKSKEDIKEIMEDEF